MLIVLLLLMAVLVVVVLMPVAHRFRIIPVTNLLERKKERAGEWSAKTKKKKSKLSIKSVYHITGCTQLHSRTAEASINAQ